MPDEAVKPIEVKPPVQAQRQQRPALPGVVFDSDMGANIDAALALALLYGASAKVKVIGVTVSNPSLEAAAYCDVLGRFYASGGKLNTAPPHYYAPVGYVAPARKTAAAPMLAKTLTLTGVDGKVLFGNDVAEVNDTADVAIVFRNALMTQKDGDGVVVVAGPATNLVRAMAFPGNKELMAAKVGVLVIAAGSFGDSAVDPRVKADVPAIRKVLTEWPAPIVFVGREAGAAVPYPAASIARDFAWSANHPVVEAYKAYQPGAYDAPAQAVLAALYATAMKDDLMKVSDAGTVEVSASGQTTFTASANGRHRRILAASDGPSKHRITQAFTTLASTAPVAPAGRGGFRAQQNQAATPAPQLPAKP